MIAVAEFVDASDTSPLDLLASQILGLSGHRGRTPVLVAPPFLSLRRRFFVELVRSLAAKTTRPIRIDWYRPVPNAASVVTDALATWSVARTNRAIAAIAEPTKPLAVMQMTVAISRPGGVHRDLVVGWCAKPMPLPPWTTEIRLSC